MPLTKVCLSVGEDLARTLSLGQMASMPAWVMAFFSSRICSLKVLPKERGEKNF